MATPPALALRDVSVSFSGVEVLRDITWSVGPGERWVVLGANGAGKTTLMRVAALRHHPSSGSVEVLGFQLGTCDVRTLRTRVAFSSPALAARLTGRMTALETVMTAKFGALAPWWNEYDDADRSRARELLDRLGCGELAEHSLDTLSAGETQRTLLARTLMTDPGIVLLDEPTAGLDVGGREQLVADLSAFAGDAPPVVLITHHVEEIPTGFTHALVLKNGAVQLAGAMNDVVTSEVLSECYDLALRVEEQNGRYAARLAH